MPKTKITRSHLFLQAATLVVSPCALALSAHAQSASVPVPAPAAAATQPATVVAQAVEAKLPTVVVEGASIAAKPAAVAKPKAKPMPVQVDEPAPPPVKKKAAAKPVKAAAPVKAKAVAKAQPAAPTPPAAAPSTAADGIDVETNAADTSALAPAADRASETMAGTPSDALGTPVSVISGAQMRAQQLRTLSDGLRSLPGVSVSRGGTGLTQVRLRGGEANHTLVLIDGVEANETTTGEFDFSDLSAEDVEQVEVIRGPQSGLYGSGAVGGVVNIITKSGRGPLTLTGRVEGGSFDTSDIVARAAAGTDRGWGSITYHKRTTHGFDVSPDGAEQDGSTLQSFAVRAGMKAAEDITVDFNIRKIMKEGDRDGFGGTAGFLATAVDDTSTFESDVLIAGANVRWDMLGGALSHVVRASINETSRSDVDRLFPAFPYTSANDSATTKFGYLATLRFDTPMLVSARHTLSGLIEHTEEQFTALSDFEPRSTHTRNQMSTVAEYTGTFGQRLHVAGSVRFDNNDSFEDTTSWRTSAAYALKEWGLRPHASIGTGVKMPTQFEQFGSLPSFFIPNPNLKPETSRGWDAGLETTLVEGVVIDVTYFQSDLENRIRTIGFPSTPINQPGTSEREGVEVSGRFQLLPNLALGLAYTYLEATDPDGQAEPRRANHTGRADVTYTFDRDRGRINVAAIYNGAMDDIAFRLPFYAQERVSLDDYWLVNVAASYKVSDGVEVFGRVENLLDQRYQEVYGYETAGIAGYAGVRLTFEEPSTRDWIKYR